MKHAKHTPGPWTAEMISADTEGNTYTMIVSKPQEVMPNLRLIAAAPDLLEALCSIYYFANLQALLESKYSKPTVALVMQQMQQAIDKARGES